MSPRQTTPHTPAAAPKWGCFPALRILKARVIRLPVLRRLTIDVLQFVVSMD